METIMDMTDTVREKVNAILDAAPGCFALVITLTIMAVFVL